MNRHPLLLSLALLLTAPALPAAEDSPVFVVKNEPVPPPAITAPAASPQLRGLAATAVLTDTTLSVRLGDTAPVVIDPHASAGCPPVLITFPDDSALLIWRGHGDNDSRDLRVARFTDNAWQPAATLNYDDWRSSTVPPGEGPAVDSRGPHIAVAWMSGEGRDARINVSTSSNAGVQWLQPNRVDDIAPVGRPSIALLDDGSQLVSWVERPDNDYVILLRRISVRGTLSVPVQLARLATDPGHPRLTRVKDGDATPAQLLLAYNDTARLITLPSPAELAAAEADSCGCDPRPEDQRGFGIKGRILSADPNAGTITLSHAAIPGVMKAGTTAFKAAPDLIAAVSQDQVVIARIEHLGPDWWLFNIRTLGAR